MHKGFHFLWFICLFVYLGVSAQNINALKSNKRQKSIYIKNQNFILVDSFALINGTLQISKLDTSMYSFNYATSILTLNTNIPDSIREVELNYRVSFLNIHKAYQNFAQSDINRGVTFSKNYQELSGQKALSDVVDLGGINYTGTFGRGLTFGNNQSMSMNSNLNLQFSGYVTDSILVTASISDNSLPIQPEGNTQQLQEFDQIFIKLEKNGHALIVGDHELFKPTGYFMNFYKRNQGINYQGYIVKNKKYKINESASISVAKGKFNRNIITPKDGNQGPYRLSLNDGNLFFIVIANSERVYIDGTLLKRGENEDFVINYNSGEITFMPRRLINKDMRIIVEFESINRSYVNSLIFNSTELDYGNKFKSYLNIYSNQDAPNQPINADLTDEQKRYLSTIGDSVQLAYVDNFYTVDFDKNKIQYKKIDTLYQGQFYSNIFVINTDPNTVSYQVGFNYVGMGNGDYTIASNSTNGKSYIWLPPIDGKSQGDYIAQSPLVTPVKQQLITTGIQYKINNHNLIKGEIGYSNYNPNGFSKIDRANHGGISGSLDYNGSINLNTYKVSDSLTQTINHNRQLDFIFHVESLSDHFRPIVRYRNPEFERDWGSQNQATYNPSTELLSMAGINYTFDNSVISFKNEIFTKDSSINGMRNSVLLNYFKKTWTIQSNSSWMTNRSVINRQTYSRPNIKIEKLINQSLNWKVNAGWQLEDNKTWNTNQDSLKLQSYKFKIIDASMEIGQIDKIQTKVSYLQRKNFHPNFQSFEGLDLADNYSIQMVIKKIKNQTIQLNSTYRNLKIYLPDSNSNNRSGGTIIGRLQYDGTLIHRLITQNLIYEMGTGQEQKRSYFFAEVAPGQGQYYWNDYNNDSIKQLNEFELALYPDQARFIKLYSPTNQFVNAQFVTLNYRLQIDPINIIKRSTTSKLGKFFIRFNLVTSVQLSNKIISQNNLDILNPFKTNYPDTSLIYSNNNINQIIYFNRNSAIWGLTYNITNVNAKSLLTYGLENKTLNKNLWQLRLKISQSFIFKSEYEYGTQNLATASEGFSNRNYTLPYDKVSAILNYTKSSVFRASINYSYKIQKNTLSTEQANTNGIILNSKWNIANKSSLEFEGTYNQISYNGQLNNTVSYVMLQGLLPGKNYIWKLNWSQKILKNVEMLIEYDGRIPANSKTIHIGRATVRAVF